MGMRSFNEGIVKYNDDQITRDAVFDKILEWFINQEVFSGECLMQSDAPIIDSPDLLSDIADDLFEFKVEWKE